MKSLKKSLKESHDIIFLKIYCTRFEKFGLFKSIWSIWHPYFSNILLFVKALHITLLTMTGGQSGVNIWVRWYPKLIFGRNRIPHVLHAFQNRTKTDLLKNTLRMRRSAKFQDFCTVTPLRLALSGKALTSGQLHWALSRKRLRKQEQLVPSSWILNFIIGS